jgi:release factor glutamine methyltransferase
LPVVRLLEVIQKSTAFLTERGVESARLQVEWILAASLGVPRLQLYLQFERVLGEAELGKVREAVRRRGRREPLQHVLGTAVFCGLEFEVGPGALVPRPETELLAERGWQWLGKRLSAGGGREGCARVLDWGTGTGCLAVTLAVRVPQARVVALDISPAAAELARRNVARHGVSERVRVWEGDGAGGLAEGERFDLVVSNPPYIPTGEIAGLEPEVREFDPKVALDGGADGLEFYRRLAVEMRSRLEPDGAMLWEFGDGQGPAVVSVLETAGWIVAERHKDYSGRERFLMAEPRVVPGGAA